MTKYTCVQRGCEFEHNGKGKPKKCKVCRNPMIYEGERRYFVGPEGTRLYSTTVESEVAVAIKHGFNEIDEAQFTKLYNAQVKGNGNG